MNKLKSSLENTYNLIINDIQLIRKMIGEVYLVSTEDKNYVLKLYQEETSHLAKRSIKMGLSLKHAGLLVPTIYPTKEGDHLFLLDTKHGYLMDYIDGIHPKKNQIKDLALTTHNLHKRMSKEHPRSIETFKKDFFIDRFFQLEDMKAYDAVKKAKWKHLLDLYYQRVQKHFGRFSHGDLHNENILKTKNDNYYILDFDQASYTSALIDIASMTDQANFNYFHKEDLEKTIRYIQDFFHYYQVKNYPIIDILSWIPIRHVELIATITLSKKEPLNKEFLDQQYTWFLAFDQALKQVIKG